jgi:hypothetical protein
MDTTDDIPSRHRTQTTNRYPETPIIESLRDLIWAALIRGEDDCIRQIDCLTENGQDRQSAHCEC